MFDHVDKIRFGRKKLWREIDLDRVPDWPCCYVIYLSGKLVYVGQTENMLLRWRMHRTRAFKEIDRGCITIKVKLSRRYGEWAMAELRLIKRLQPPMNRAGVLSQEVAGL